MAIIRQTDRPTVTIHQFRLFLFHHKNTWMSVELSTDVARAAPWRINFKYLPGQSSRNLTGNTC